jgi:hypothetical protein
MAYRLEYRDDLVTGNWGTLVDGIFSSTTIPMLQIVDPNAAGLRTPAGLSARSSFGARGSITSYLAQHLKGFA